MYKDIRKQREACARYMRNLRARRKLEKNIPVHFPAKVSVQAASQEPFKVGGGSE